MTGSTLRSNFQRLLSALLLLSFVASSLALVVGPQRVRAADPIVIFLTSGTSWTVPSDWDSSNNTIEVIGGGGGGRDGSEAGNNAGGGGEGDEPELLM